MTVTFNKPITIGDLTNQIQVTSMEVITVAFNLAPATGNGNMNVSVTLRDPVSGYQAHFLYEDNNTTPAFWNKVEASLVNGQKWLSILLNRLITDGKIPAATVS